jgi:hypothetical protein
MSHPCRQPTSGPLATHPAATSLGQERRLILGIAHRIAAPTFGEGPRASLRRGSPEAVANQVAFHLVTRGVPDADMRTDKRLRWAAVVQACALCGTCRPEVTGTLLHGAGVSSHRVGRLLTSHGSGLQDQVRLLCRRLRSHLGDAFPIDLVELVLADEDRPDDAETLRAAIARSYYRHISD